MQAGKIYFICILKYSKILIIIFGYSAGSEAVDELDGEDRLEWSCCWSEGKLQKFEN